MERRELALACLALVTAGLVAPGCGGKTATTPTTMPAPPITTPPQTGVTISIVSNSGSQAFSPNPASVPAGQTVVFRNTTGSNHRLVADSSGGWDSGTIAPGTATAAITVGVSGSFHCTIHGSMVGSITVGQ